MTDGRFRFMDSESAAREPKKSIEEKRRLLTGITWERLLARDYKIRMGIINGVILSPRLGSFLGRPSLAVISDNKFVVLRTIPNFREEFFSDATKLQFNLEAVLPKLGFLLLVSDFVRNTGSIKLTDLVIDPDQE